MFPEYHNVKLCLAKSIFVVIFLFLYLISFATHNRAGEITYRQISDLTFEVTIITYTSTGPGWTADRPDLEVFWGDNTSSVLPRCEEVFLPDYYKRNKYVGEHTFRGPGIYAITVEDPNRNANVENIPNSVNTLFAITTTMIIEPTLGYNNTPMLTQAPVDKAAIGQIFIHNPGAYDPDGDSLSYKLTECRAENGLPIPNYSYPPATEYLKVDEITGDLIWKTPMYIGVYNVAMLIEEWRNGVKIGEIIRDMQIEVFDGKNNAAPQIDLSEIESIYGDKNHICVEAGTRVQYTIKANDVNNDTIDLYAGGAPFVASADAAAGFIQNVWQQGYAEGTFTWQTTCDIVRKQPYILNIKAQDRSKIVSLVDIESLYITIVAKAVRNFTAEPTTQSINLSWQQHECSNASGYNIYRKIGATGFVHDFCQTGVPEGLGYQKIAHINGRDITHYIDYDVSQGHSYCYLICATFPDGAESYASAEVCTSVAKGLPVMTNVSVENTDYTHGKIYIAWQKPSDEDLESSTGPYQYVLFRSKGFLGDNFEEIAVIDGLDNTEYTDSLINTIDDSYSYKIEFYNNADNNRYLIGSPSFASSVFIDLMQMESTINLRIRNYTPWINDKYEIYRSCEDLDFENVGLTTEKSYEDKNLENGKTYCYYVRSNGHYSEQGFPNPILNKSQQACKLSIDTVAPCTPVINVVPVCDSMYNSISWYLPDSCNYDADEYVLYFTPKLDGEYQILGTFDANTLSYKHYPVTGMAGCYYIVAKDAFDNVSEKSPAVCVDACSYYELPNVFTPNGDNINDFYHPIHPYYFVEKVDMTIYDRWGLMMFETDDPEIMWDGRSRQTNQLVSPGVYFYTCDVYEQRLTGLEVRHLKGFIHVFRGEHDTNTRQN